jgi:hypothetical protein
MKERIMRIPKNRTSEVATAVADPHAPVIKLNPWGVGIRTYLVCACGWDPESPEFSSERSTETHAAHRAAVGMPALATYAHATFGDTAIERAQGLTWREWSARNRRTDVDAFTGRPRAEMFAACLKG